MVFNILSICPTDRIDKYALARRVASNVCHISLTRLGPLTSCSKALHGAFFQYDHKRLEARRVTVPHCCCGLITAPVWPEFFLCQPCDVHLSPTGPSYLVDGFARFLVSWISAPHVYFPGSALSPIFFCLFTYKSLHQSHGPIGHKTEQIYIVSTYGSNSYIL